MNTAGVYGYDLEFRTRIVDLVLGGATPEEAVHIDTVKRYLERQYNNTLHVRVRPTGRHRTVTVAHEEQLLKQLETHPDTTSTEHTRTLEEATGLKICFKTVDRVFVRHQITHKKTVVALERREDRRTAFLNDLEPYLARPGRLVFLDESGFQTNMTRGYARAPRHLRAVFTVPRLSS